MSGSRCEQSVMPAAILIMAERGILQVRLGLAPGFIAPFSTVGVRFLTFEAGVIGMEQGFWGKEIG